MGTHPSSSDPLGPDPREYRDGDDLLLAQIRELLDSLRRFDDEDVAEAWLATQRWPDGVRCPRCDSDNVAIASKRRPMPYRCRLCRIQFSVKSHSPMRGSKLPFSTWAKAFHICSSITNPAGIDIRNVLPVSDKTARTLACRIHEGWRRAVPEFPELTQGDLL